MIFLLTIAGKCAMIALAFGGVAQLGERTVRIRKVESSILFVSTNNKSTVILIELRWTFVYGLSRVLYVIS